MYNTRNHSSVSLLKCSLIFLPKFLFRFAITDLVQHLKLIHSNSSDKWLDLQRIRDVLVICCLKDHWAYTTNQLHQYWCYSWLGGPKGPIKLVSWQPVILVSNTNTGVVGWWYKPSDPSSNKPSLCRGLTARVTFELLVICTK